MVGEICLKTTFFQLNCKKSAHRDTAFEKNAYLCHIVHYWTTT